MEFGGLTVFRQEHRKCEVIAIVGQKGIGYKNKKVGCHEYDNNSIIAPDSRE